MDIHSALTGLNHSQIQQLCTEMDTGQYKLYLVDVVTEHLAPIRSRMNELRNNTDYVKQILDDGKTRATEIASTNLNTIKNIIGLK